MKRHKIRRCKACGCKRWLFWQKDETYYYWTCSKGHEWKVKRSRWDILDDIWRDMFEDFIAEYFNTPNPLTDYIRK